MELKLNQKKILWIGIGIISFYYLLHKFEFIYQASFTEGTVAHYQSIQTNSNSIIAFSAKDSIYFFAGETDMKYKINEKVTVIYATENPEKAYVFSFIGFWYKGLILCLVPIVLWTAFTLSFYETTEAIFVSFFTKKKKKEWELSDKDKLTKNKEI